MDQAGAGRFPVDQSLEAISKRAQGCHLRIDVGALAYCGGAEIRRRTSQLVGDDCGRHSQPAQHQDSVKPLDLAGFVDAVPTGGVS